MRDVAAVLGEQGYFAWFKMHCMHGDESRTEQPKLLQAPNGPQIVRSEALADLVGGFVQVDMNGQVEFTGVGCDPLERHVAYGKRRMRRKTERKPRFIAQAVAQCETFAQVIGRVAGVGRAKLDHDHAQRRANTGA